MIIVPSVVTGQSVRVAIQGVQATAGTMTLLRDTLDGPLVPVLGAIAMAPTDTVVTDALAPLNRPIYYRVRIDPSGTLTSTTQPLTVTSDRPIVSDPYTGRSVSVTIHRWQELKFARRVTLVPIEGRRSPAALVDVETSPTSEATFRTDTGAELLAFRALMAPGAPIYVRASCPGVEDGWVHVTDRAEQRLTLNASDHTRYHVLTLAHVDEAPDPNRRAAGDTLGDLADRVNHGTLATIAQRWPTLGAIAQSDLRVA